MALLTENEATMNELYKRLRDNPTIADIHLHSQGSVGQAYRIGLAGQPCPMWLPKNGSEAHQAWRAGRDNFRAGFKIATNQPKEQ
jgi:hypothetical protein